MASNQIVNGYSSQKYAIVYTLFSTSVLSYISYASLAMGSEQQDTVIFRAIFC
jgi:hypothetical protein